jgi:AraC-like DNA-binding protein
MLFQYHFSDLYYSHKRDEIAPWSETFADHFHTLYEMIYFISGDAEFIVEDRRYALKSGDLIFVNPGAHHNVHLLSSKPYERYVLRFSEYLVPSELLSKLEHMTGNFYVGDTVIPSLFSRFDDHIRIIGDEDKDVIKMLFRCVLTEIIVYFSRMDVKEWVSVSLLKDDMAGVLDYINRNLEMPLCLEDICQKFHYSKSYICREFSNALGVPIMQYVRTKKIMYADALLRSGLTPTEVSDRCGFTDYSTFYRMYKKLIGYPPSERHKLSK